MFVDRLHINNTV